jgi:hypothetical protein
VTERPLDELEVLALEMAARGCVSGRLSEWPVLRSALEALELPAWPWIGARPMRLLARDALRLLKSQVLVGP